jgi:four helix bundle protein
MAGGIRSYRDLDVWQRAMGLAKKIYVTTSRFPGDERFGLTSQMRRAAVSIASNIAEGHARSSTSEFIRFILIALGSVAELETQVILAADLKYLTEDKRQDVLEELDAIGRMLRALQKSLAKRARVQRKGT